MWWSIYLFTQAVCPDPVNVYITGCALLSLLFQGSTAFTEEITLAKYPEYAEYQKTTSRLLLALPGPDLDTGKGGATKVRASRVVVVVVCVCRVCVCVCRVSLTLLNAVLRGRSLRAPSLSQAPWRLRLAR
jgi:hypothetical protein